MTEHKEFIPNSRLSIRAESRNGAFVMSCRVIGDCVGFRESDCIFTDFQGIVAALEASSIPWERYEQGGGSFDAHSIRDLDISLNEAQRLSVIQIDSTE